MNEASAPPEIHVPPERTSLSSTPVPDLGAFFDVLVPTGQKPRPVRKLHQCLVAIDVHEEIFAREEALIAIAKWVRTGGEVPAIQGALPLERGSVRRLRMLVEALVQFPALRGRFSRLVQSLVSEQSALHLFARLGIPGDRGLLTETIDRLSRRLMPQPIDEQDITQLVAWMFPSRYDAHWMSNLPAGLIVQFIELVRNPIHATPSFDSDAPAGPRSRFPSRGDLPLGALPSIPEVSPSSIVPASMTFSVFLPLRIALLDAVLLLASRVSSAGLSDDLRARSSQSRSLKDSPFFKLPRSIDALLATPRHDTNEIAAWAEECGTLVAECRVAASEVQAHLEDAGVSIDVVYRLELIERSLRRIELLIEVLVPQDRESQAVRAVNLLIILLEERRRDLSLTDIVRTNTRLLARKVIERAGLTGEHYITATPGEFFKMFLSAAGGGVLTAGTAALKNFISHLHRPPLQEGLLATANYAGSFTAMQLLGFTLATKQPGMTGAALAGALKEGGTNYDAVVTTIARLTRSQLAAAAGNVLLVIPACFALNYYWLRTYGEPFLHDAAYAEKTMLSLHPTKSGTIAFAALTGVILWLSSLAAGWLENWAVYRRLPEAIAEHRLRRVVGHRVTSWASRFFAKNISGFGGNMAIGAMLGLFPIIGAFAGAPIEVRHVTLSTGTLTLCVLSLGRGGEGFPNISDVVALPDFKAACAGIGIILLLNLGVSFFLAFAMALRAREVTFFQALRLFGAVFVGFFKNPFRFFLPVGEKGAAAGHGHGHAEPKAHALATPRPKPAPNRTSTTPNRPSATATPRPIPRPTPSRPGQRQSPTTPQGPQQLTARHNPAVSGTVPSTQDLPKKPDEPPNSG